MSSADNAAILKEIGNDLVTSTVSVAVETIPITVYSMLVIKTGIILLGTHRGRLAKKIPIVTLAVVAIMYLICLTLWIIDLVLIVAEIRITLVKDPEVDLDVKYHRALDFMTHRIAAEDLLYSYLTFLGDGVIVWRVYAFWASDNWKLVMILPVVLLLTSVASSMMLTYCVTRLGGEIVLGAYHNPAFCRKIQTLSYSTPAATTAVATTLIGIKAWSFLRLSKEDGVVDARLSKKSKAESIVVLLLESGLAYFLFFLAQAIQIAPSVKNSINAQANLRFATRVFSYQTSLIVGMYPTIIICLVHAQRSTMDTTVYSTNPSDSKVFGRRVPISPSSFRAAPVGSSTSARGDLESQEEVDLHEFHGEENQGVILIQKQ
ncbi:hypothetical protein Moror_14860 [Moniliophthora roreri MCA 2997]|uniref:Uncharacterized protein n=2 Tax=Moniliophthora roreri TaxID=221103 RepID=V2X663_MONRO|nr:hypothetical protein Moror_14860 [Moniliophthora roreri MCA 2997]